MVTPPTFSRGHSALSGLVALLVAAGAAGLANAAGNTPGRPLPSAVRGRRSPSSAGPAAAGRPSYDLVALAAPDAPPPGPAAAVTYRILEAFAGEPPGATVTVSHGALTAEQRASLTAGDRVILLASREAGAADRWTGPVPLRATPSAIDAFRSWSAPADVRPSRSVEEVIAEAAPDVVIAPRGERPPDPPGPARADRVVAATPAAASVAPEASAPAGPPARVVDSRVPGGPAAITVPAGQAIEPSRPLLAPPPADTMERQTILDRPEPSEPSMTDPIVDGVDHPAAVEVAAATPPPRPIGLSPPAPSVRARPASATAVADVPPRSEGLAVPIVPPASEKPAPLARAASPSRASSDDAGTTPCDGVAARERVPYSYAPRLRPGTAPGIPPAPPATTLGPPLSQRTDLHRRDDWKR